MREGGRYVECWDNSLLKLAENIDRRTAERMASQPIPPVVIYPSEPVDPPPRDNPPPSNPPPADPGSGTPADPPPRPLGLKKKKAKE